MSIINIKCPKCGQKIYVDQYELCCPICGDFFSDFKNEIVLKKKEDEDEHYQIEKIIEKNKNDLKEANKNGIKIWLKVLGYSFALMLGGVGIILTVASPFLIVAVFAGLLIVPFFILISNKIKYSKKLKCELEKFNYYNNNN